VIDREVLRVRLLDVLSTFGPRRVFDEDRRVGYWMDRLMEADRPDDGSEKAVAVLEVERLRRRVAELEVAFDLERHVVADLEAEDRELEGELRRRLQRDAHVVAVEAERDALRARLVAVMAVTSDPAVRWAATHDTPSTTVVDSE
jgi:hypothetical protein